jgi:hypothetical protein
MPEDTSTVPQPTVQATEPYEETDIFAWSNNLVQYIDELKIDLFFFSKKYTAYRVKLTGEPANQLRPLFLDEILEYVLGGVEKGLTVRTFEEAEAEENVLQKTRVAHVDKLVETLNWLKHELHNVEVFKDEDHDLRHMKGVIARCTHAEIDKPFYIIKNLPTSQIMKGHTAWLLKDGNFKPFDAMSALKIPGENQLLVVGDDLFVFSQPKLKSLFGYDAKAASIAAKKMEEIEANFKLSFADGASMQALVKGKPATIKKLQEIEPTKVTQKELMDHADEMGIGLMSDDAGAIIIMDDKDAARFVNLLNDDYMESPMTGERYEVIKKRPLRAPSEEEQLAREHL